MKNLHDSSVQDIAALKEITYALDPGIAIGIDFHVTELIHHCTMATLS